MNNTEDKLWRVVVHPITKEKKAENFFVVSNSLDKVVSALETKHEYLFQWVEGDRIEIECYRSEVLVCPRVVGE